MPQPGFHNTHEQGEKGLLIRKGASLILSLTHHIFVLDIEF